MKKLLKKWYGKVLAVFMLLLVLLGVELLRSNYALAVSSYQPCFPKITQPIRIVFLSDLHGREFGADNARLLNKIAEQEPDLIAFVGDFINGDADEKEIQILCSLVRKASKIAPVYYSMGNHEYHYMNIHGDGLISQLEEAGAVVVDNNYVDITVNGTPVRIGGYMGYYPYPHMTTQDKERQAREWVFFVDYLDTDRFKLLLDHIPTSWLDWKFIDKTQIDLVLSGHYHGGVIRIPFLEQGLIAPYIGWNPPYTKGIFTGETTTCVLTTGLAGYNSVPRLFNTPEICVVDLLPAAS